MDEAGKTRKPQPRTENTSERYFRVLPSTLKSLLFPSAYQQILRLWLMENQK